MARVNYTIPHLQKTTRLGHFIEPKRPFLPVFGWIPRKIFRVSEELLKEFFSNEGALKELTGHFVDVVHGLSLER